MSTPSRPSFMCHRVEIQGADPGVEASTGHTALTWAAVCGFDLVAAELLLGDSSNSNNDNNNSGTSVSGSMGDAITAVTRTTAVEGKTALHNAAFNGNSGVVVLLLDRLRDLLLRTRYVGSAEKCSRGVCRNVGEKKPRENAFFIAHGWEFRERAQSTPWTKFVHV